jgi:sugar lactone lactonase YvrE
MAGCAGENCALPASNQSAFAKGSGFAAGSVQAPPSFLYVENFADSPTVTVYRVGSKYRQLRLTIPRIYNTHNIVVDDTGTLYVAESDAIEVFSGPNKSASYIQDINGPSALALDSEQNLYVADAAGGIEVFSPGGKQLLRTIADGVQAPSAMIFDSEDNLYVANGPLNGNASVTIYPKGASDPSETITYGIATPRALAVDANQTLYVLTGTSVKVYPSGSISPSETIRSGIKMGEALAIDRGGKLFVGGESRVTVYKPGSTAIYRTLQEPTQTTALAFDGSGRLYVATQGPHKGGGVFVYRPGSTSPELRIAQNQGVHNPIALAIGPR